MAEKAYAKILKNLRATTLTQIVVIAAGVIRTLALPKAFDTVEAYGYWQIYMFYLSYVLIFTLGYHEGLYLRYGGRRWRDLPDGDLKRGYTLHCALMLAAALALAAALCALLPAADARRLIYLFVALKLPAAAVIEVYSRLYQATDSFQKYSLVTMADKVAFLAALAVLLPLGVNSYRALIAVDAGISTALAALLVWRHRRFLIKSAPRAAWPAWRDCVRAGSKVMASSYIVILATGYGRFLVERFGDLRDYAHYSLGVSVLNVVLVAVGALSILLYPLLKQRREAEYPACYAGFGALAQLALPLLLMLYYPLAALINAWLSRYAQTLVYLPPLLALTALNAVGSLSVTPFMKASRQEKNMLRVHLIGLAAHVLVCTPLFLLTRNVRAVAWASLGMAALDYGLQALALDRLYSARQGRTAALNILLAAGWALLAGKAGKPLSFLCLMLAFAVFALMNGKQARAFLRAAARENRGADA